MKITQPVSAKILQHSEGMGVPSPDNVRKRAIELARIDGREEFTEEDWKQSQRELHGGHPAIWERDEQMAQSVSERDMVAGSTGHHIENQGMDEGENLGEELVAEGMDEAVHDQMLAASKKKTDDI